MKEKFWKFVDSFNAWLTFDRECRKELRYLEKHAEEKWYV